MLGSLCAAGYVRSQGDVCQPRNWLACAHRLSSGGGLLLDAGEGCLAQLTRAYGAAGAAAQVAALAAVWVSHRHADHMLGLPALLAARPPSAPPLLVIGAWQSSWGMQCADSSLHLHACCCGVTPDARRCW
jgi:ribonuclease BN (tRNA processing enzyme)